jgi:hypothetical protein
MFKAADKWLERLLKRLHEFLVDRTIEWRFNLVGRLIGLFKRAFYKTIGNGTLKWE